MRGETGRKDGDNPKNVRSVVRGDTSDKMEIYDNGAASVREIDNKLTRKWSGEGRLMSYVVGLEKKLVERKREGT